MIDYTPHIREMAERLRRDRMFKPQLGSDLRLAIMDYCSTRYLGQSAHEAAKFIVDRLPGEFPRSGARAAE